MKLAVVRGPEPGLDLQATVWNAFVNLLAMSEPGELDAEQRQAQLVFWYESEVQNGGHLQYFVNRGEAEAELAVLALRELRADSHSEILASALQSWQSEPRRAPSTVEEYVSEALEAEFASFDQAFGAAESLSDLLERHLGEFQSRYVAIG